MSGRFTLSTGVTLVAFALLDLLRILFVLGILVAVEWTRKIALIGHGLGTRGGWHGWLWDFAESARAQARQAAGCVA